MDGQKKILETNGEKEDSQKPNKVRHKENQQRKSNEKCDQAKTKKWLSETNVKKIENRNCTKNPKQCIREIQEITGRKGKLKKQGVEKSKRRKHHHGKKDKKT